MMVLIGRELAGDVYYEKKNILLFLKITKPDRANQCYNFNPRLCII